MRLSILNPLGGDELRRDWNSGGTNAAHGDVLGSRSHDRPAISRQFRKKIVHTWERSHICALFALDGSQDQVLRFRIAAGEQSAERVGRPFAVNARQMRVGIEAAQSHEANPCTIDARDRVDERTVQIEKQSLAGDGVQPGKITRGRVRLVPSSGR